MIGQPRKSLVPFDLMDQLIEWSLYLRMLEGLEEAVPWSDQLKKEHPRKVAGE